MDDVSVTVTCTGMAMLWFAPYVMLSMLLHAVSAAWLRFSCGTGVPILTLTVAVSPWLSVAVPVAADEVGTVDPDVPPLPPLDDEPLPTGVVDVAASPAGVDV